MINSLRMTACCTFIRNSLAILKLVSRELRLFHKISEASVNNFHSYAAIFIKNGAHIDWPYIHTVCKSHVCNLNSFLVRVG